jgi:phosphohistidine phosphatase SixA
VTGIPARPARPARPAQATLRASQRTSRTARAAPTLYLVRHAKAESREGWEAADSERPLTRRGHEQARVIAGHLVDLVGRRPARVLSSPATRCRDTVVPLAAASGLDVVEARWLSEGSEPEHAFDQLRKLTAHLDPPSGVGGPVVACTHGDVIWGILERLARLSVDLGPNPDAPKGGVWIIKNAAGDAVDVTLYRPDVVRA